MSVNIDDLEELSETVLVTPENHQAARVCHIYSGSLGERDLLCHRHNRRHCLVRVDSLWIDEGTHLSISV